MRRLLLASGSPEPDIDHPPPDPVDPPAPEPPVNTTPYAMPTAAPYNAPTYAITPTPDGTGSVVHPDVIDFGSDYAWNGWRYWMAVTPYYRANASKENPVVLTSHDGFTWQHPTGQAVTYLFSGVNGGAQSDTDLVYDPTGDRLVMIWREYQAYTPFGEFIYASTSTDGVTWSSPRVTLWTDSDPGSDRADNTVSQALVRVSDTDWRAWTRGQGAVIHLRTATDPLGTWSAPVTCTMTGARTTGLWHLDVIRHQGRFLALLDFQWELRAAVSTDGITWTVGAMILTNTTGWDSRTMYRSTMQPHEDGQRMRLWYSSDSADSTVSWRVGYTHVPMSFWTSL